MVAWVLAGALVGWTGLALAADAAAPSTGNSAQTSKAPGTMTKIEKHRTVRGELTAVQPDSLTLKLGGKSARTLNIGLTDKTKVREGKTAKSVSDLKIGERVAIRYDQGAKAKPADWINILREAPTQG
jgi:hypothetical protein